MEYYMSEEQEQQIQAYIERRITEATIELHNDLASQLVRSINEFDRKDPKMVFTAKETADYLDVSTKTLHNWDKDGILPKHTLGGKSYWLLSDIIFYITKSGSGG